MDKNTILGLVLIFLIMIGFGYLIQPSKEQREAMQRRADSLATVQTEELKKQQEHEKEMATMAADSVKKEDVKVQLGSFATSASGEEKFYYIENNLLKIRISNKGGRIYSVELKNYKTYSGKPLVLFNGPDNIFGLKFWGNNKAINTNDLYFNASTVDTVITADAQNPASITMRLAVADTSYIEYVYKLSDNTYLADYDIHFKGMENIIANRVGTIDLDWVTNLNGLEKGIKNERDYTTIAFMFPNNDFEELNSRSDEDKKEITTKVKWIDFKHQFFSSILIAKDGFLNTNLKVQKSADDEHVKLMKTTLSLPFRNDKDETINLNIFFGPNRFKTLKNYNQGFEKVIPLGHNIIRWINRYVIINLFNLLGSWIASYGIIILLMTIIIKIVFFPLTYKSYLSSAKMRVLKPQVEEINKKYPKKEDAMKKQQAVMGLYKKVGVNPMGGCIPMLIQFPILIAMFRFFPASFELRQQSFLWADDLSSYDSILHLPFNIPWYGDHVSLFTLLMAIALFISSKMNSDQMGDANSQMPGMKFMMTWMMPIMMVLWFNNYSAGLSYYYFLSNVITIAQTMVIRRFVDDDALLAKLHANSKKTVTKSKWQARLEAMAKQQEMQKKKR